MWRLFKLEESKTLSFVEKKRKLLIVQSWDESIFHREDGFDLSICHTLAGLESTVLRTVVTIKDNIVVTKDGAILRLFIILVVEGILTTEIEREYIRLARIEAIRHINELTDRKNGYIFISRH